MTTKRRTTWRRWLVRLAVGLVVLRLLLAMLLPWLVALAAGSAGLDVSWRSSSLSLHRLSLRFEDLVARDAEDADAPPLLSAQEIVIDLSARQLLGGDVVVVDAAVAGARIHVQRRADGSLRLPAAWQVKDAVEEVVAAEPDGEPVRFDLPLQVASARLHDLHLAFEDLHAEPARTERLAVDVDVADLGHPDRSGQVSVRLHSPGWFDEFWLHATVTTAAERLALTWRGAVRGVAPDTLPMPPAMRPVWRPVHTLGVDVEGELRASRHPLYPHRTIVGGHGSVTAIADGHPLAAVELRAEDSAHTETGHRLPFAVAIHGDTLVDSLRLANGRIDVSEARTTVACEVVCTGLSLRFLAPWLRDLGIVLPADGIEASARVQADVVTATGTPSWEIRIDDGRVAHGDQRVTLPLLHLVDLRHTDDRLAIESVTVLGPDLALGKAADGTVSVAGVQFLANPGTPAAATSAAPAPPAPATTPFAWPRLSLRSFDWRGITLAFTDASLATPATLRMTEGNVQATNLELGSAAAPGRIVATGMVPDAIGGLRAEVRLTPEPDALGAELQLRANDVTFGALAPWLAPAGLTPVLANARLQAMGSVRIAALPRGLVVDAALANLRLEDGGETLLSLRHVDGKSVTMAADGFDLGTWQVLDPFLAVHRDLDGSLTALGLRWAPPVPATPAAATAAPQTPPPAPTSPEPLPTAPARLAHGELGLRGAVVRFTDLRHPRAFALSLGLDVAIGADAGRGEAVTHDTTLRLDEAIRALRVHGSFRREATRFHLDAEVDGSGIHGAGLDGLLPEHVRCTLADGAVRGRLQAEVATVAPFSLSVRAAGLQLRDGDTEVAAIDEVVLEVPTASADLVHVKSARLGGVRATLASTTDGLQVPALRLGTPVPPVVPLAPVATTTPPVPPLPLPPLRLDELDLHLERLVWRDRTVGDGLPVVTTCRLRLAEPWATAADPADSLPLRFTTTAAIDPFCREATIAAELAPFEMQPVAEFQVHATGIDTTRLAEVMPRLRDRIVGTADAAEFSCRVLATLDLRRRDVRRFDFSRAFGGELVVENVRLQQAGADPWLAAELVTIDARTIDPQTGDLLLRLVEVDAPALRAERTTAGLELLGVRLLAPARQPTSGPTEEAPAAPADPATTAAQTPTPTLPATAAPAPEFAIERLRVQGLRCDFVDSTTTPATRVPVREGDLVVQNLSSRALEQPRPIGFSLTASGGMVELERRVLRSSVVAGFLGSAAGAIAGNDDTHTMEQRPLVEEVRVVGQVALSPQPMGQVRTTVRALELTALRGLAKGGGVDVADGVVDLDITMDLRGEKGIGVLSRTTFTWLSLSEPPGGPISTYLRLPAPLDTVLFLLRNDADEHVIPVAVDVPSQGMGGGAIAGAIGEALARVLADAVASAAFRAAGALTGGALGAGAPAPLPTTAMSFQPGESIAASGTFDEVLAAVAADDELGLVLVHELGAGDLQRAAELANPPANVVAASLVELRRERDSTTFARNQLAAEVAALHAAGRMHEGRARHGELARIDARLGTLEQAVDAAQRMLAGENERTAARRTKLAAVAMAERRLAVVRGQLLARLGPDAASRIEVRRPRAVEAADTKAGGRVAVTVRRRTPP